MKRFLASLAGQAITGRLAHNQEQLDHGDDALSLGRYLASSDFGQAVMENWQSESEGEQMIGEAAKGSSPKWAKAGGWRAGLYGNSLLILMGLIFLRQRGSPESKPVGAAHTDTGLEG